MKISKYITNLHMNASTSVHRNLLFPKIYIFYSVCVVNVFF
jgi:hypothetical protein